MTATISPTAVTYDRQTGALHAPDTRHWLWARSMQLSHRLLAPVDHIGISRVHGLLNRIFKPKTDTIIIDGQTRYTFPSFDYYWNRMLDSRSDYEPELDELMLKHQASPFVFLDLGANFGYWTAKVAAGRYGAHRTIAVEPSDMCQPVLKKNATHSQPVALYKNAIDEESGRKLNLYGERHAGLSIDQNWYGASSRVANTVETITIDDLVARENIDPTTTPLVVKLDVEAVELRALKGATRTLAGQSIFYIEDAEKGQASDALRYLVDHAKCGLFYHTPTGLIQLRSYAEINVLKRKLGRWHAHALNLFATSSPLWLAALGGDNQPLI